MIRCTGCMREYADDLKICPYCGTFSSTPAEKRYHLRTETKLVDRYIVGKAVNEDNVNIKYIGFDLKKDKKVFIYEFYPKGIVLRSKESNLIQFQTNLKTNLFGNGLREYINEIEALKKLSDTKEGKVGIERITDCFVDNNTCYTVCRYEEYSTLGKELNENGQYDEKFSRVIAKNLVKTLAAIHSSGIVLGNISPEHIAVTEDGGFKFIDFGVSALTNAANLKIYNPIYSPPEAIDSNGVLTKSSDVYSMGCLCYKLITGVNPYPVLQRRSGKKNISIRGLGIKVDRGFDNAVMNAMNLSPKDRYEDAGEFLGALKNKNTKRKGNENKADFTKAVPVLLATTFGICILSIIAAAALYINKGQNDTVVTENTTQTTVIQETTTAAQTTTADEETSTESTSSTETTTVSRTSTEKATQKSASAENANNAEKTKTNTNHNSGNSNNNNTGAKPKTDITAGSTNNSGSDKTSSDIKTEPAGEVMAAAPKATANAGETAADTPAPQNSDPSEEKESEPAPPPEWEPPAPPELYDTPIH